MKRTKVLFYGSMIQKIFRASVASNFGVAPKIAEFCALNARRKRL
jgi:hypothetical protein